MATRFHHSDDCSLERGGAPRALLIRRGLLLAVLALAFGAGLAVDAPATATDSTTAVELPPRLAELDRALAEPQDLRARFRQEKRTALLKRPLVSEGAVMTGGGKVLWRTETPQPSTMLVAGGEIRLYYPDAARLEVYRVEERLAEMAASPLPRLATLAENFAIEDRELAEGRIGLTLVPRTELLREQVETAEIVLAPGGSHVEQIEFVDADGDRTTITFLDVETDVGIDAGAMVLEVPAGTEVYAPQGAAR